MRKNATNEFDENDPISLKSYLDTILPPKESSEDGQIYMQLLSTKKQIKTRLLNFQKI